MLNRSIPNATPTMALTKIELALLGHAAPANALAVQKTLAYYLNKIASAAISHVPMTRLLATC